MNRSCKNPLAALMYSCAPGQLNRSGSIQMFSYQKQVPKISVTHGQPPWQMNQFTLGKSAASCVMMAGFVQLMRLGPLLPPSMMPTTSPCS